MAKQKSAPAQPTTQDDKLPETAVSKRADKITKGLLAQQTMQDNVIQTDDEPSVLTPEEETWKLRHGDLRRYTQQKENDYKAKIDELQSQVTQLSAVASQPMPKTKEEFDAFVKKYPDIVVFIEMIADMKASERTAAIQTELDSVKSTLDTTKEEKDLALLEVLVPDYKEIMASDEYMDWKEAAPNFIRHTLDTSDDPQELAAAFNMYKRDTSKPVTKVNTKKLEALDTSVRNSGIQPSKMAGVHKFTTSQIKGMSTKEFEQNEKAIEDARARGLILDDMRQTRFPTG